MELARLDALRYSSTRYHPTHLRANIRMTNITPPENRNIPTDARRCRLRIPIGDARAKSQRTPVIEIKWIKSTRYYAADGDSARMRAFQDFLSEDETDDQRGGGTRNGGTDAAKTHNETVESHIVLTRSFQTSSFSD